MICVVDATALRDAIADVVALAQEFKGDDVAERLARFGFDGEAVGTVAHERWECYREDYVNDPQAAFFIGFMEALLAGKRLGEDA